MKPGPITRKNGPVRVLTRRWLATRTTRRPFLGSATSLANTEIFHKPPPFQPDPPASHRYARAAASSRPLVRRTALARPNTLYVVTNYPYCKGEKAQFSGATDGREARWGGVDLRLHRVIQTNLPVGICNNRLFVVF